MGEAVDLVDKEGLDSHVKKHSLAVVLFHASWNKESQALLGELSASLDVVPLFKVDMGDDDGQELADELEVNEPPCVLVYLFGCKAKVMEGKAITAAAVHTLVASLLEQCGGLDDANSVHRTVQTSYANTAKGETGGIAAFISADRLGYSEEEREFAMAGGGVSDLGLGCGNPLSFAALQAGETVLDLGSGAGFDAFLAGRAVGPAGRVIGVDMTPEMVAKARDNAQAGGHTNVEFRQGMIEDLPVEDGTVDVIISNCVINLSPDKQQVYGEMMRVLRPGGRMAVNDVVATAEVPNYLRTEEALAC
mmetsp:Transcript_11410/g.23859  ORF Transcript_11410/g.23859 Transcript_11410/m.23859 type:complete len:306 (-) Transcript_11410:941-1858(-)